MMGTSVKKQWEVYLLQRIESCACAVLNMLILASGIICSKGVIGESLGYRSRWIYWLASC